MPLDQIEKSPVNKSWGIDRAKGWKLKLCLIPRTCCLSNKRLWGKYAYHGTRWIHGPGEPVQDEYWVDQKEFLLWQLKEGHNNV